MKKTIIIAIIYLLGCFISYIEIRADLKRHFKGEWTTADRCFAIGLSTFSWLSVSVISIHIGITTLAQHRNTPANW